MNLQLENKNVLVTGSSGGLGKASAIRFLEEGARVAITGLDPQQVDETCGILGKRFGPGRVFPFAGDLTQPDVVRACVDASVSKFGSIDVLVANIGNGSGRPGWDIREEEWEQMMALNFAGARRIAEAALPHMVRRGNGALVFVASIAGKESIGAPIHYGVAKASLIAYSKMLAHKLAGTGIRVNSVCPGNFLVEGGTWDRKLREDAAAVEKMLEERVPLRRLAQPEEVADLIVFLVSGRASFITGSCFVADGGQTVSI